MRDCWYSDNRDLVKWATLIHLADASKIKTIFQVAFYRPAQRPLELLMNRITIPFPGVVLGHFRDVGQIRNLARDAHLRIKVFKHPFDGCREVYFRKLLAALGRLHNEKLIAFFDPDTGIAPDRHTLEHVLPGELGAVFQRLKPRDCLVLYQHRQRRRDWITHNRRRFAYALDLPLHKVKTFSSPELAPDVVLFAAEKEPGNCEA